MSRKTESGLKRDVEGLLEQSVVAEVEAEVGRRFERALAKLSPEERGLLEGYFAGQSPERLAASLGTTAAEVLDLVGRAKRNLLHQLRAETNMRQ